MIDMCRFKILIFCIIISATCFAQEKVPVKAGSETPEQRAEEILSRMTLEEKITMLGGYEDFYIRPNERLGIPAIKMADGPLGVRNYGKATAFPAGICMASTWNTELVSDYGVAVGDEARSKGVHIMLAPGVNIYRAPMCGRNFEYFGEDPWLASRMAVAYINGLQSREVVATVKHFVANNQEYDRYNVSSDLDARTLHEIYLPAFRAAVEEANVGAVMNSYNLVNGTWTSEHPQLLTDILKKEWNFNGFVMSDWGSTHHGVAAANAGLDLEMPKGDYMNPDTLLPAIKDGRIKVETIDDKIRRMLATMFLFGFFDREQKDTLLPLYNPGSARIALQAAREGIVLLKNESSILPLDAAKIKSIAVIGPDAHPAVTGGGGSSIITPYRSVSFLDGIIQQAGDDFNVYYHPGVETDLNAMFAASSFFTVEPDGSRSPGLKGEYLNKIDLSGTPVVVRKDLHINFNWQNGSPLPQMPADSFSIRWSGKIEVASDGDYYFYASGNNGFRLSIDGEMVINKWESFSFSSADATVPLKNGIHDILLEYFERQGEAQVAMGWRPVKSGSVIEAARIAKECDIVVLCVGFNANTEGEGFDRPFELPAEQVDLIKNITRVNKNTIVVLTSGGNAASMEWLQDVKAYLAAWYPGQEGGTALAEILFGKVNPSGKLPATFEKEWKDNASFNSYYDDDKDKHVRYSEGIFTGYRHFDRSNIEPLYPFGYGLSYTSFSYSDIRVEPGNEKNQVRVSFDITNTGKMAGSEVAQVYVSKLNPGIDRPLKELKGFSKIFLEPSETKRVEVILDKKSFEYYDTNIPGWNVEGGDYEILVGSSSRDIHLKGLVKDYGR